MRSVADAGGRAESAALRLTLMVKPGCPLCDQARDVLEQVAAPAGCVWDEADILASEPLFDLYRDRVPVLRVGGADVLYGRFPPLAVRRALGLSPPVRAVCFGLESSAAGLAAAGFTRLRTWEDGPQLAVVSADGLRHLPPDPPVPVVLAGDRSQAVRGVVAVLPAPLYVPDLAALAAALLP